MNLLSFNSFKPTIYLEIYSICIDIILSSGSNIVCCILVTCGYLQPVAGSSSKDFSTGFRLLASMALGRRHAREFLSAGDAPSAPHHLSGRRRRQGIGSAVVALIYPIAKREGTFLSATEPIRRLWTAS